MAQLEKALADMERHAASAQLASTEANALRNAIADIADVAPATPTRAGATIPSQEGVPRLIAESQRSEAGQALAEGLQDKLEKQLKT